MAGFTAKFQLNNISRNLISIVHFMCIYMNIFDNELNWQNFINWIGFDLFNDDTCPTEHISRPTQVGSLTVYNFWQFISDRRIRLLVKIPLCKSRESSQRGSSKSQSCCFLRVFIPVLFVPIGFDDYTDLLWYNISSVNWPLRVWDRMTLQMLW